MKHPVHDLSGALGIQTMEEGGKVLFLIGDTWVDGFPFALFAKKAVDLKARAETAEAALGAVTDALEVLFSDCDQLGHWLPSPLVAKVRVAIHAARAAIAGNGAP